MGLCLFELWVTVCGGWLYGEAISLSSADSHTAQQLIITAVIAALSPHNYQGEILDGVAYDEMLRRTVFTALTIT